MDYKLSQLVNLPRVQTLTDLMYDATGISVSVTDPDGTVLANSGWQEVCRDFHWASPKTSRYCRYEAASIPFAIPEGQDHLIEPCRNGLFDAVAPVTVLGQQVGHFVAGQFFTQPPDLSFFKKQAHRSKFDESAYMKAISKVPVIDEAKLTSLMRCFSILTEIFGEAGVRELADVHTALRVLLKEREEERTKIDGAILSNVKNLVLPYVEKLRSDGLSQEQKGTIDIIEANLKKITSPLVAKMESLALTPREITIASLLKEGKTTKQISQSLNLAMRAVEFHRYNIRKKLGLGHKKTSLKSYLRSIW